MSRALRKVVVVFKTHFDLGFTGLPDEVMAQYTGPMFEAVMRTMDATANEPPNLRYAWTLPAWPLQYLLHNEKVPETNRRNARKLVEDGRLHWHVWPFTTHTAFCGLEDMVRGLHISRSLSEEFRRWPTGAKQTDVPGHTWIFPSLLVGAGVDFLHLGCNAGSHPPHVPRFFWWEGPDGARLLTFYSPGGYGTSLLPPPDWEYDTWISLQETVDNIGPHTPEQLYEIRRTIEKGAPEAEIVFGQLGDFSASLLEHPEQLDNVPVVPYDLADTWIHGVGTMPREVARARKLRGELFKLEAQATMLDWPRPHRDQGAEFRLGRSIAPYINKAYEQLMLFGEHTWGLDVKSTIKRVFDDTFEEARKTKPYRRLEASWDAKGSYVTNAESAYESAETLVRTRWREVFDQLHQERMNDPKHLEFLKSIEEGRRTIAKAAQEGATSKPKRVRVTIPQVENVLENHKFRIEVDPVAGGISSLIDKSTGHEWVDKTNPEPFGGYRYDIYSAVDIAEFLRAYGTLFQEWFIGDQGKPGYPEFQPHITAYARNFKASFLNDEVFPCLELTGGILRAEGPGEEQLPAQTISIKITLIQELHLAYKVESKHATPLTESMVVPFPLNIQKPAFRLGQQGSVIDPARDIEEGANRDLWCIDRWVDVTDDRMGMAVVPIDMPLVSIGNVGIHKFQPTRIPKEPVVYAHLANTQWATNFPQWLEGDCNFNVVLKPHSGDWRLGELWQFAPQVLPREIMIGNIGTGAGILPIELKDGWNQEQEVGLILMTLHPRHDGQGLIVRYWDALGTHRFIPLDVGQAAARVWRCDLMERPIEELKLYATPKEPEHYKRVSFTVEPHGIITLLIEFD